MQFNKISAHIANEIECKGAIKMADVALEKAKNADVRTKAQMIRDKQKDEVARMENMLKEIH